VTGHRPLEGYRRRTIAVWELTLKCNLACSHCGSRAGAPRDQELTTSEALGLVAQLREVGIREVALIGGEAYLRPDWLIIAAAIADAGMVCSMTTAGFGLSAATAARMKQAGMRHVSVSVDGLAPAHDRLRGRAGSFAAAMTALRHLSDAGLLTGANTQINRLTAPDLPALYEEILAAGVEAWQLQLTVPSGNAADHPEILLQPCELGDLYDVLARIAARALIDGMSLMPGNNIGYHGPYTALLEAAGASPAIGAGCAAGLSVLGIEADGTVKGCPSLPAAAYGAGNVRRQRLETMRDASSPFNVRAAAEPRAALWGFCARCRYAETCRGGCTWTAHAFFDRPGNNPYCHHRALTFERAGRRERVVQARGAPGVPFDNGVFRIVEEALDAPWPADDPLRFTAARVRWSSSHRWAGGGGPLRRCRGEARVDRRPAPA
jgi:radical SAM protein with 4Fe4S-binding SPASM domain